MRRGLDERALAGRPPRRYHYASEGEPGEGLLAAFAGVGFLAALLALAILLFGPAGCAAVPEQHLAADRAYDAAVLPVYEHCVRRHPDPAGVSVTAEDRRTLLRTIEARRAELAAHGADPAR